MEGSCRLSCLCGLQKGNVHCPLRDAEKKCKIGTDLTMGCEGPEERNELWH